MGQCLCDSHWTGDACDVLKCQQHNCSSNGQCSAECEIYVFLREAFLVKWLCPKL